MKAQQLVVQFPARFVDEDDWIEYGKKLARTERGIGWLIGEWWNVGERYGYRVERAQECGFKPAVCRQYGYVVKNVSIRIDTLPFRHHQQVAALPAPEQETWLARAEKGKDGKPWSAMTLRREIKKAQIGKAAPLEGKYRVIYADPPWQYNDKLEISKDGSGESYGPADAHYHQMSIEELCALDVENIAEDNAVLFLWATVPLLEASFKVIAAWGFKYKTNFVWDKIKHNMGHYNSVRHEHLLVCTRGACTPDELKLFDSVQSIERSSHSQKPEEFRHIIDSLYTIGNKIELFARGAPAVGWHVWGNETKQASAA